MAKINIFSSPIIISYLENNQLHEEIIKELNLAEQNNLLRKASNQGGLQTKNIHNKLVGQIILEESLELLKRHFSFKKETQVHLNNIWINKNKKNNFNDPHVHPYANFSGIYYLDTPSDGGELVFHNNDVGLDMVANDFYFKDECFKNNYRIQPKPNMFILFGSQMRHMVEPHFEDNDRISVSFNISFQYG